MNRISLNKRLFLFLFSLLVFSQAYSKQKPKLVVGIVVDQMSNDYLRRFADKFSEGGFKRLLKSGFYFKSSYYDYVPTVTAAGHSCVYTGTLPFINGVIANEWYDRTNNKIVYCADDENVRAVGVNTPKEKFSAKNLLASTVTDELVKADKNSRVISISLKDRGAVFCGGHLGKTFWFDNVSGKFITSTYYMDELPEWARKFNERNLNDFYLSQIWNTFYPIETYTESTADDVPWETLFKGLKHPVFPYDLSFLRAKNPELLEYTAYGNDILKDFALTVFNDEKLGQGNETDFFCISFSSTDKVGHHFGPNSIETEDTYLRLDKNLEELFNTLDKAIGFDNILLFLTSDHGVAPVPGYLESIGVSSGNLDTKNLKDSIDIFLSAKYGNDDYVLWIENHQIYFNYKTLLEKNLSVEKISVEVGTYILNYKGIIESYTAAGIESGFYNTRDARFFQNGFIKERCGDVMFALDSNWITDMKRGATHGTAYRYDVNVPLIWFGGGVIHGETDEYNSQCDIAPTISEILDIRKPDKSVGKSLMKKIIK
ncbi:MAG: alkaline phosphatase family protein [Bacteroidetes bacterium]|nr:alkaline phosphatase family protein [Bacteroidota bacterium]